MTGTQNAYRRIRTRTSPRAVPPGTPGVGGDVRYLFADLRRSANVAVVICAIPTAAVLLVDMSGTLTALLTVLAFLGSMHAASLMRRASNLPSALWPTVATLALVAVVRGPIGSHDLWSYAFNGRSVSVYRTDPFNTVASNYPHDVVYPLVGWRNTPMVYGPAFGGIAATVTAIAGDSLLLIRLGFQLVAAACVVASLRIVARVGRPACVVLFALQPFVWVSVVNGGHNDAIVALLLVVAAIEHQRTRPVRCAAALSAAALVKMTAGLALIPFAGWLAYRRRWRDAAIVAGLPIAALLASAAMFPGSLTNAAHATTARVSMAAIWRPVQILAASDGERMTALASVVTLSLVVFITWRRRRDPSASLAAGAGVATFGFCSAYTLPWYSLWGLPTLTLSGDIIATALVAARGSLMLAAYQLRRSTGWEPIGTAVLANLVPWVLLSAFTVRVARHQAINLEIPTRGNRSGSRSV